MGGFFCFKQKKGKLNEKINQKKIHDHSHSVNPPDKRWGRCTSHGKKGIKMKKKKKRGPLQTGNPSLGKSRLLRNRKRENIIDENEGGGVKMKGRGGKEKESENASMITCNNNSRHNHGDILATRTAKSKGGNRHPLFIVEVEETSFSLEEMDHLLDTFGEFVGSLSCDFLEFGGLEVKRGEKGEKERRKRKK